MKKILSFAGIVTIASLLSACGGGSPAPNGALSNSYLPSTESGISGQLAAAPAYKAVALPSGFIPTAMMPSGKVPGSLGKNAEVFDTGTGTLTNLGTYGSEYAVATSVNKNGVAVGYSNQTLVFNTPGRALLFSSGVHQLAGLPASVFPGNCYADALAISDTGVVYGGSGECGNGNGPRILAFVRFSRTGAAASKLPPGAGIQDQPLTFVAINTSATFASTSASDGGPNAAHAFVGSGSTDAFLFPTDPAGSLSTATGINDLNQVVGIHGATGYRHDSHGTTSLSFTPISINNSGTIVGYDTHGVIVYFNGVKYYLHSLLTTPLNAPRALPGISANGSFVVQSVGKYYAIEPR